MNRTIIFDTETSGPVDFKSISKAKPGKDSPWNNINIAQIGYVVMERGMVVETGSYYIQPIDNDPVINPYCPKVSHQICTLLGTDPLIAMMQFFSTALTCKTIVAHNLQFDYNLVLDFAIRVGIPEGMINQFSYLKRFCTMRDTNIPGNRWYSLQRFCNAMGTPEFSDAHDALSDAMMTAMAYKSMWGKRC